MKIVIPGGSGQVGAVLARHFHAQGHAVTVLSRTRGAWVAALEAETLMRDVFSFAAPLPVLGRLAEVAFLRRYMRRLLLERNAVLKEIAESSRWQGYLS